MPDSEAFAVAVLVAAAAGLVVLAGSHLSDRLKLPLPALVLVASAVAARAVGMGAPSETVVSEVVSIALVGVLFNGGMHVGLARFRSEASTILVVGVAGTFGTVAGATVLVHAVLGVNWYVSLLLATALSPTDPTVVFSVLGRRQVGGGSGTVLEGESGANDPVGISLMTALIAGGGLTAAGAGQAVVTFVLQMAVGAGVGLAGGRLLLWVMRHVPLPGEGLYPLRTLSAAFLLFGAAGAAHGSGFLAVFVAGVVIGDERAPYKREIEHFHSAVSSLGEIVAFVVLGLTVDLPVLERGSTWLPAVAIGVSLAVAIRPVVVGLCLLPAKLSGRERLFVQFAGLKGAVPILLGSYLLAARVPSPGRLYEVVVVVVVFSVVVQGSLVGPVARLLRLPVHVVQPEPWTFGVRLRERPQNVHHLVVSPESPADGATVAELEGLPDDAWVTLLVREGRLVPVRGSTLLEAGDQLTVLADPNETAELQATFGSG